MLGPWVSPCRLGETRSSLELRSESQVQIGQFIVMPEPFTPPTLETLHPLHFHSHVRTSLVLIPLGENMHIMADDDITYFVVVLVHYSLPAYGHARRQNNMSATYPST